ncbi:M10 family metallopeptidase C-terminal domain-containing protein [Tardiphaga alba]|uniref:M10 family metallopeptidase C-terminal domain-containing protein n=1 Tax=Tardiphaga alba TaxID=340268 RepID=UPI001BA678A2|nr:cadherin-like domain-containing protein [Tardiphaga alba]
MNYAGTFDFSQLGDAQADTAAGAFGVAHVAAPGEHAAAITVPDANLLFSGDYKRAGLDLVLSKDGQDHIVADYFNGAHRAALSSPDGATLSPDLVKALVGEVQVAQAGGATNSAAQVIGTVSKLAGSATAIRNGVSVTLNVGDPVQKGDVVQAGADSSLTLTFIDGTVFGLSANARMVLNEMVYDPAGSSNSSLLSLIQGTITFVAGETAKNGDMRVDTPVATMGIRGTAVLVEIGFEVPGQGGAPPVKFQVLVEPNGYTGSYVLYSKTSGQPIGTVNQAGQVTSVTGAGDASTGQADPLSQMAQAIIQQTLQTYFPNYVPNANPRSNGSGAGSTPADPLFDPIQKLPNLIIDQPNVVPINLPGNGPGAPPITVPVIVTPLNTAPIILVTPVTVILPVDANNFKLSDQVTITDPDANNPVFNDVIVPYVAGSGRVASATGPGHGPSGTALASLVTVDPVTGQVSYDPAAFKYLAAGEAAVFTIAFQSRSGPDTVSNTITVTIVGVNDAPEITSASLDVAQGGYTPVALSDITISDPDSTSFTYYLSATHGTFEKWDGESWVEITSSDAITAADITAGHVRFHHDGSGDAPTATVIVSDGSASSTPHQIDIDFTPANTVYHLTSTQGLSIDVSAYGATNGFAFPGAGNVTTPLTQEDRIVLAYQNGNGHVALNNSPMMGDRDMAVLSSSQHTADGKTSVSTTLNGGNGLTLKQVIELGDNANYFTTTVTITNTSDHGVNGVRFMRNFDPDQDVGSPVNGSTATINDVINGTNFAIVSAQGTTSHTTVAMIGLSGTWRGSVYGFTNEDPYSPGAYDNPVDPNGSVADQALSLTYHFGTIAAHTSATVTYITTNNIATNGDNALYGTISSDTINGFKGNDLLIGLGGNDKFVFDVGSGHDTILDFAVGADTIDVSAYANLSSDFSTWLSSGILQTMGGDTLVHLSPTDTILLKGVAAGDLTAADFGLPPPPNHAPVFDTSNLSVYDDIELGGITLRGLSVSDPDSAGQEFSITACANLGDVGYPEPSPDLANLNENLSYGINYQPSDAVPPYVEKVQLSVFDASGASDTINIHFAVAPTGPVTLTGGQGKDLLVSTGFNDTLTGGAEADQFIFGPDSGHDTITDFKPGTDRIDLQIDGTFAPNEDAFQLWLQDHATSSTEGLRLQLDDTGHNTVLLTNVTANQLHVSDFIVHDTLLV